MGRAMPNTAGRRKSVMEDSFPRQPRARRFSLATTTTATTPFQSSPPHFPNRHLSAFRPTTTSAGTRYEGTFRSPSTTGTRYEGTFRPTTTSTSSPSTPSTPRSSSPEDKVSAESSASNTSNASTSRSRDLNFRIRKHNHLHHQSRSHTNGTNHNTSHHYRHRHHNEDNLDDDDGDEEEEDVEEEEEGEEEADEQAAEEENLPEPAKLKNMRPRTYSLPAAHVRGGGVRPFPSFSPTTTTASSSSPSPSTSSSATTMMMMQGGGGDSSGSSGCWKDVYTCPVRSFSRTTKGVVNRGDSVRKCSLSSLLSSASGSTVMELEERSRALSIASQDSVQGQSAAAAPGGGGGGGGACQGVCGGVGVDGGAEGALAPAYFRVAVLGTVEVGKSALCRQFMSSEYLGTYGDNCDGEDGPCIVSVMLDGEESMIEFTEGPTVSHQDSNFDAYIIVFSITDRSSFDVAAFLLRHLRVDVGTDRPIIMVANKVDLVRQRRVSNAEARELVSTFDGKYTETSAALNDHVDDLLVGTLSQIRFQLRPPPTTLLTPPSSPNNKCRTPSPLSLFSRFVKYATRKSSSCDNLLLQ